jgi:hypothetical protein
VKARRLVTLKRPKKLTGRTQKATWNRLSDRSLPTAAHGCPTGL